MNTSDKPEKRFSVERKIQLLADSEPITFVHRYAPDRPENHILHINPYIEIYVYISGEADYIVQDTYYGLTRGDIIAVNPMQVHKAVLKRECMYERFYLLIPVQSFAAFVHNPLGRILNRSEGNSAKISLEEPKRGDVLAMFYDISRLCREPHSDGTDMLIYSRIMQLLCVLDSALTNETSQDEGYAHIPPLLADILSYIHRELPYIQSAASIAQHFQITPPYLSALFRKHIGTPIKIYIRTQRIALAKRLLGEGMSVTDACYESGFSDCSYFIRHFKQCVGMTPLKYKNMNSGSKE